MTVRAGILFAALLAAGCSGEGGGGTTGGSDGGPGDGGSCHALDAGCSIQADCGEPAGGIHVYTCTSGRCERQAGFARNCSTSLPLPQIQVNLAAGTTAQNLNTLQIRAFYPQRVDGSTLHCSDVLHTADYPDGGSPLDADTNLNLENISAVQAVCSTQGQGCSTYLVNMSLAPGNAPVILVQSYSGGRDTTGTHATGVQLADGCIEGQTVSDPGGAPQTFPVVISAL